MTDVEIRGRYLRADGDPATGVVTFVPRSRGTNTATNLLRTEAAIVAVLDDQGAFTVTLQATDDPAWSPSGWTYQVRERVGEGGYGRRFDIEVPAAAAGTGIDLADVAPVEPAEGAATAYVLASAYATDQAAVDARLDALEAGGGGSGWQSYAPEWTSDGTPPTLGNGTLVGDYLHSGDLVTYRWTLTWGSTTDPGVNTAMAVSLPVPADTSLDMPIGHGWYINHQNVPDDIGDGYQQMPDGGWWSGSPINSDRLDPFNFGMQPGDVFSMTGTYRAASA